MSVFVSNQGFTLLEVLIALVVIIGISSIACQHHLNVTSRNRVLAEIQEDLFLSESEFDVSYGAVALWME